MKSGVEDFTAVSRDKPHLFWLHDIEHAAANWRNCPDALPAHGRGNFASYIGRLAPTPSSDYVITLGTRNNLGDLDTQ